jgi:hypothetical protein
MMVDNITVNKLAAFWTLDNAPPQGLTLPTGDLSDGVQLVLQGRNAKLADDVRCEGGSPLDRSIDRGAEEMHRAH